jgi:hypothetical protein
MVRTVQITAALGALLGLVLALDSPAAGGACRAGAAACVGRSFAALAQPYAVHALVGAAVGLAAGMALLIAWRARGGAGEARAAGPARREPIPERVRHEVWRRDRGTCVDCGSRARLEFDHIVPVSRGGSSSARNVELRCEPCNRRKGARI